MSLKNVQVLDPWIWGLEDSPAPARFFEEYGQAVRSRTFAPTISQWYSRMVQYRSETGSTFHGAEEMSSWMTKLFFAFERVEHVPEHFVQIEKEDGNFRVHAGFRRQLWLKGNHGDDPDVDTPVAWVCTIGPADETGGYLGMQFKEVSIYWDKTKTVGLLGHRLPSD